MDLNMVGDIILIIHQTSHKKNAINLDKKLIMNKKKYNLIKTKKFF